MNIIALRVRFCCCCCCFFLSAAFVSEFFLFFHSFSQCSIDHVNVNNIKYNIIFHAFQLNWINYSHRATIWHSFILYVSIYLFEANASASNKINEYENVLLRLFNIHTIYMNLDVWLALFNSHSDIIWFPCVCARTRFQFQFFHVSRTIALAWFIHIEATNSAKPKWSRSRRDNDEGGAW